MSLLTEEHGAIPVGDAVPDVGRSTAVGRRAEPQADAASR